VLDKDVVLVGSCVGQGSEDFSVFFIQYNRERCDAKLQASSSLPHLLILE